MYQQRKLAIEDSFVFLCISSPGCRCGANLIVGLPFRKKMLIFKIDGKMG